MVSRLHFYGVLPLSTERFMLERLYDDDAKYHHNNLLCGWCRYRFTCRWIHHGQVWWSMDVSRFIRTFFLGVLRSCCSPVVLKDVACVFSSMLDNDDSDITRRWRTTTVIVMIIIMLDIFFSIYDDNEIHLPFTKATCTNKYIQARVRNTRSVQTEKIASSQLTTLTVSLLSSRLKQLHNAATTPQTFIYHRQSTRPLCWTISSGRVSTYYDKQTRNRTSMEDRGGGGD